MSRARQETGQLVSVRACGIQRDGFLCSSTRDGFVHLVVIRGLAILSAYTSGSIHDAANGFRRIFLLRASTNRRSTFCWGVVLPKG
jgi:hypothetical protein